MTALLRVEELHVQAKTGHLWWRKQIDCVRHVSFRLAAQTTTAYIGLNGAGKSSTFRVLAGLSHQYQGRLFWKGKPVLPQDLHSVLGFLPEHALFYRDLSGTDFLLSLARFHGLSPVDVRQRIAYWAERLAVGDCLHKPLKRCSKGQSQRIGFIQAILHRPELLILDEPLSGLDPLARQLFVEALKDLQQQGMTILFSSHILSDAERLADSVIVLHHGRLLHQESLSSLIGEPTTWEIRLQGEPPASQYWQQQCLSNGQFLLRGAMDQLTIDEALRCLRQQEHCHVVEARACQPDLQSRFIALLSKQDS